MKAGAACILIAAVALGGCNPDPAPAETRNTRDRDAKKEALLASYERERLALTRNGQGCPGHILRNQELRNAVVGKKMAPKHLLSMVIYDAPSPFRAYLSNGELRRGGQFGEIIVGRYWVAGDDLCFENPYGKGCSRLVRGVGDELNEELLDDRDPEAFRLACVPMQVEAANDDLWTPHR